MKNSNGHPVLKVLLIDDSIEDEELIKRELGRTYKVVAKGVQTEAEMALEEYPFSAPARSQYNPPRNYYP